ncbi:MAG: alkylation response protein AidB-like acyl-CoA dehydrogenase [Glaciecola sp.]|jgi:alkylation response protein AidB-like acyl-CoA dehydrogenase
MDFRLPEDHVALVDLARTIIREHCAPDRLTRLEQDGGWLDRDLWSSLASSGILGATLPVDVGGASLDSLATHGLLREVGAAAAHVPFYETVVLGARVIDRCASPDLRAAVLTGVVSGSVILTAALEDEAGADAARPTTSAEPNGEGWVLHGRKIAVPCATIADHLVVSAVDPDGRTLLALIAAGSEGLQIDAQKTPSDVPHGRILLDGVVIGAESVLAHAAAADEALADLLSHARVGLASMQDGLVAQAVTMAAEHTSTREQFGRPIATFQAVRQRVADARIASEMLALTSLQAAWMLADGLPATDEVLIAKWWAGEAGHVAMHAVQHVHGGIGVDREYPLHRLFGRAKSHEFSLGTSSHQLRDLGARIASSVTA